MDGIIIFVLRSEIVRAFYYYANDAMILNYAFGRLRHELAQLVVIYYVLAINK